MCLFCQSIPTGRRDNPPRASGMIFNWTSKSGGDCTGQKASKVHCKGVDLGGRPGPGTGRTEAQRPGTRFQGRSRNLLSSFLKDTMRALFDAQQRHCPHECFSPECRQR